MFAPRHQDSADELVRVCRPGGTIGLLCWTPEGQIGALFRAMGPFAPPPPPGASPPPLWGGEDHLRELFGDRVDLRTLWSASMLEITAVRTSSRPVRGALQGQVRANDRRAKQRKSRTDGEGELDDALDRFCDEWNLGTDDAARFEMEYLLAVGTRR